MRNLAHRRRVAVAARSHATGLEYGLIAAAITIAIVTVLAGLGARYGTGERSTAPVAAMQEAVR